MENVDALIRAAVAPLALTPSRLLPPARNSLPALVILDGGQVRAYPHSARPRVRLGRETGEVRYVGPDRTLGVHFDRDPIGLVSSFARGRLTILSGGRMILDLEALLATHPEVDVDLDDTSALCASVAANRAISAAGHVATMALLPASRLSQDERDALADRAFDRAAMMERA